MNYINYIESEKRGILWSLVRSIRYIISTIGIYATKKRKTGRKYTATLCAIFKNEGIFLQEWIEYHQLIGIEHFYLYNNFSNDNYKKILEPYIQKGVVTLIEWPVQYGQLSAYKDCYQRFRDETQWIGYIDLDEFICLSNKTKIQSWLSGFLKYPCVHIYWKMFGTSGLLEHDSNKNVIEQYTSCWPNQTNVGKSFINTNYNITSFNCHLFYAETYIGKIKIKILPVNEFKKFIHHWKVRTPYHAKSEIQINHYYNRSYALYLYKSQQRGDACSAGSQKGREDKDRFAREENQNTARDYTIQRFLLQLKLRLKKEKL